MDDPTTTTADTTTPLGSVRTSSSSIVKQINTFVSWKIDETIAQLSRDYDTRAATSTSTSISPCVYPPELLQQVLTILRHWATQWKGIPAYKSFLDKKSLYHEIEECLPALHYLNQWRLEHMRNTICRRRSNRNGSNSSNGQDRQPERFVAMDVCGGKGCFTMLLRYMATYYWNHKDDDEATVGSFVVDRVILLEKAKRSDGIDWHHVLTTHDDVTMNKSRGPSTTTTIHTSRCLLVPVELWDDCNLHETDTLVERIRTDLPLSYSIAPTGIHLCKLLSPALVSLVNLLGPQKCPYLCVVPCCMPRAVTKTARRHERKTTRQNCGVDAGNHYSTLESAVVKSSAHVPSFISVSTYETNSARKARKLLLQRRDAARRRKGNRSDPNNNSVADRHETGNSIRATNNNPASLLLSTGCYCCHSEQHQMQFCPVLPTLSEQEQRRILDTVVASSIATPCWSCGIAGHYRVDCPNPRIETTLKSIDNGSHAKMGISLPATSLLDPPRILLDVTDILASMDPMRTYCNLLLKSVGSRLNSNSSGLETCTERAIAVPTLSANNTGDEMIKDGWKRTIYDTELVHSDVEQQPLANWNAGRKSLYLVASYEAEKGRSMMK